MKELIPIIEHKGQKAVTARVVYDSLGLNPSHWSRWYKSNIVNNEFAIEFEDWEGFATMVNGNPSHDFILTLKFAKKLAMLTRSEKGEEVRDYFIGVEEKAKEMYKRLSEVSLPSRKEMALWVIEYEEKIEKQAKEIEVKDGKIEVLQPKADLMDQVLDTEKLIDIGQTAKILGLPYGRNTLYSKLRQDGIFFKNRNEPLQQYISSGYFMLKEKYIENIGNVVLKVLVTQKGLKFLAKRLGVIEKPKQMKII